MNHDRGSTSTRWQSGEHDRVDEVNGVHHPDALASSSSRTDAPPISTMRTSHSCRTWPTHERLEIPERLRPYARRATKEFDHRDSRKQRRGFEHLTPQFVRAGMTRGYTCGTIILVQMRRLLR